MLQKVEIRQVVDGDIATLKGVLESAELFPAELLDPMIRPYLEESDCKHIWLTACVSGVPIALAFCVPEQMTEGTWNLLAIAIHPSWQRQGIGARTINFLEEMLGKRGERVLLVETSSLANYEQARCLYAKYGFTEIATIPDFYRDGEDKVIFMRKISIAR